jgi:hypothetical protein
MVAGPAAELAHRVVAKVRPQPRRRAARSTPVRSRTNRGPAAWNPTPLRGLEEAHKYGLPLVSGKRSGNGTSDHDHGDAIDVGTLPSAHPAPTAARRK